MGDKSNFQYVLIGVFIFLTLLGVFGFAGIIPLPKSKSAQTDITGNITIWGTESSDIFIGAYDNFVRQTHPKFSVTYVERPADTFDSDLVEAIASGNGPDAILLPQDLILRYADKVYPISYTTFTQRQFQDTFIDEGDLFLQSDSSLAIPFIIDPMVMYWNRDLLASAGIAEVPKTWDQFYALVPQLTKTDQALNISAATLGFGEYRNVTHAKDLLALLIMQAGNPIDDVEKGILTSTLEATYNLPTPPTVSALQFYTSFADPSKSVYTWNRSLPESKQMFLTGDLAFYFGYASEAADIRAKSPHLNFDVAMMPQPAGAKFNMTFGNMQGLALLKSSKQLGTAYAIMMRIVEPDYLQAFAGVSGLPPVRRDMLATAPTDSFSSVFYQSALISRAWLDPQPPDTAQLFQDMIENVTSGRYTPADSVHQTSVQLTSLLHG